MVKKMEQYGFQRTNLMVVIILNFKSSSRPEIEVVISVNKDGGLMLSLGVEFSENLSIIKEIVELFYNNSWEITV